MSLRLLVEDWPEGTLGEGIVRQRLAVMSAHPELPQGSRGLLEIARCVRRREGGRMNYQASIFINDLIQNLTAQLEQPAETAATASAA